MDSRIAYIAISDWKNSIIICRISEQVHTTKYDKSEYKYLKSYQFLQASDEFKLYRELSLKFEL